MLSITPTPDFPPPPPKITASAATLFSRALYTDVDCKEFRFSFLSFANFSRISRSSICLSCINLRKSFCSSIFKSLKKILSLFSNFSRKLDHIFILFSDCFFSSFLICSFNRGSTVSRRLFLARRARRSWSSRRRRSGSCSDNSDSIFSFNSNFAFSSSDILILSCTSISDLISSIVILSKILDTFRDVSIEAI